MMNALKKEFILQRGVNGNYTHEALDELFCDDPVFREVKRRLASMQIKTLLADVRGMESPRYEAEASVVERQLLDEASGFVHALLYPEEAQQ